jgi:hypothetical protein
MRQRNLNSEERMKIIGQYLYDGDGGDNHEYGDLVEER